MSTYNTLGAVSDQPELAPDIEAQIFDWLREFQDDLSDHLDEALRLGGHLQWVVDLVERAKTEKDKEKRLGPANVPVSPSAPDHGSPTVAAQAEPLPARARGGTPSDSGVASPPTVVVSAAIARRNRMRAEAAKADLGSVAVALDEARKRAALSEPTKKNSPETQPSVAPKVEIKPDAAADRVLPDRGKAVDGSIMTLKAAALENQRELSAAAPGRRWIDFQRERDISDIPGTYINAVVGSFHRVLAPLLPLYKLSTGIISITTITIGITA
jgi:hypothetical protein